MSLYTVRSRVSLTGKPILSSKMDEQDPANMPVPLEFKSAMEMLHWSLANGVFGREFYANRSPRTPEEIRLRDGGDEWRAYRVSGDWPKWELTNENYDAMVSAAKRYRAILHYFREIEPEWTYVETIHYADNSTMVYEINRNGQMRSHMTVSPHGDIC